MKTLVTIPLIAVLLAGCAVSDFGLRGRSDAPDVAVIENPGAETLRPRARPDGEADGQLPQTGEAPPEPAQNGYLGETLAGLGSPGETGQFLVTGLVRETRQGRVETESGQSLTLELRPSGAAPSSGSHISLQAMQALGLSLAGLSTLKVYVD